MGDISRVTTFTDGTIISAGVVNDELDQLVSGHNENYIRLDSLEYEDLTLYGSKTFNAAITIPITPSLDTHAASKNYVDTKFNTGLLNFNATAAPIYTNTTQFSVATISCQNSTNTSNISKTIPTTVDIATTGLNGVALSGTFQLLGTVTVTAASATVTGTNTLFLTDFRVGDIISVTGSDNRRITVISSNTSMTVSSNFTISASNAVYYRGGRAPDTWYNLYAISDGITTGLLLSTRNTSSGDSLVDKPSSVNTVSSFNDSSNVCTTLTNHNLRNGLAFKFQDAGSGVLPFGLSYGFTYYASVISPTSFKVHNTQVDAIAGTNEINFTASGSGTVIIIYDSYSNIRQLPFALKTFGNSTMAPFRVTTGWPTRPLIMYETEWDEVTFANTTTGVLTAGAATSFTDVYCNAWIPPISKEGYLWFWSSVSNRVSLKAKGSPSVSGYPALTAAINNSREMFVNTDASQAIQYKVSTGNTNIAVKGYIVTEII